RPRLAVAGGAGHGPCWGRPRAPQRGCLRDSLLVAFEGLRTTVPSVAMVLSGPVQDQAALSGRLDRSSRWAWSGWDPPATGSSR
ncbi:MAG TPA: hypothetical protein VGA45_06855, partial [Actinomycetota bacterium]